MSFITLSCWLLFWMPTELSEREQIETWQIAAPLEPATSAYEVDLNKLDLFALVVARAEQPAKREPQKDIRIYLRPDKSIIDRRAQLDSELTKSRNLLEGLNKLEAVLTEDLAKRQVEFDEATSRLLVASTAVKQRVRQLLRLKPQTAIHTLAASSGYIDFQARERALRRLVENDVAQIKDFREITRRYAIEKSDLTRRKQNLANVKEATAFRTQIQAWDEEERKALIDAVKTQPEYFAAYVRDFEKLDDYIGKECQKAIDPRNGRLYIEETKGKLASPIYNPDIRGAFGQRTHRSWPVTYESHGWTMVPERWISPVKVRAAYWGYVVFYGELKGLGKTMIIDHTLGYTSVYAHLQESLVKVGEKVKTGDPIAIMGDSGSYEGEQLYFELRKNGVALDPAEWIRK